MHPKVSDGGEHLAHNIMSHLKSFKPYNYFDETRKECGTAMDKIIELYKEDHYGEELVKDIQKVYAEIERQNKSRSCANQVAAVLNQALDEAVASGYISINLARTLCNINSFLVTLAHNL
jgi:hypothetical protein